MKHHTPLFFLLFLCITTLSSCVTGPPKAATSKHANSISAGYSVNQNTQELYGMVTFQILDLEKGNYTAVITFENPDDPESPFTSIQPLDEKTKFVFMHTPGLKTVQQNKRYTATLTLHKGDKNGKVVSKLKQPVLMTVSPVMAEELEITTKILPSGPQKSETSKTDPTKEKSETQKKEPTKEKSKTQS